MALLSNLASICPFVTPMIAHVTRVVRDRHGERYYHEPTSADVGRRLSPPAWSRQCDSRSLFLSLCVGFLCVEFLYVGPPTEQVVGLADGVTISMRARLSFFCQVGIIALGEGSMDDRHGVKIRVTFPIARGTCRQRYNGRGGHG